MLPFVSDLIKKKNYGQDIKKSGLRIIPLLCVKDVVILASSIVDLQLSLGWFAAERDVVWIKNSIMDQKIDSHCD